MVTMPTRYIPGRMSTSRSTLRTALVKKVTGLPSTRTTRRPFRRLPGVRPAAKTSKRTSYAAKTRKLARSTTTAPKPLPNAPTAAPTPVTPTRSTIWSMKSTSAETNREPTPASVSSRSTPSGVAIVMRSSNSITTTVDRFSESRSPGWRELELLVSEAGRRPERLGPEKALRLGALYRSAAADLATARRRFPHDPAVARLEALVGRARHLVYDAR